MNSPTAALFLPSPWVGRVARRAGCAKSPHPPRRCAARLPLPACGERVGVRGRFQSGAQTYPRRDGPRRGSDSARQGETRGRAAKRPADQSLAAPDDL